MKLLIVESPSKAKTLEKYLGKDYQVKSSVGHIRDLPKTNKDAIDIQNGFTPRYEISQGKTKVIRELISSAKKADEIFLASDPDREGEAIAWHINEILKDELGSKLPPTKRITFNEITKSAVLDSLEHPREINQNLKEAQEARRVLDRIVGYDLSGLIWKKVRYGLSAGRVQSPALRILMEREREIRSFNPEAYYVIEGIFQSKNLNLPLVCSKEIKNIDEALEIVTRAEEGLWSVTDIKETKSVRRPKPPFTTSTLQQTASSRLGFSPSRTMRVAQKLYESGYITYMRTDSLSFSKQALAGIASYVEQTYGKENLNLTQYKTQSKNAQEAHEAIRPTKFDSHIYGTTADERALYELILKRAVSSQMKAADIMRTKLVANIDEETGKSTIPDFISNGSRILSLGWLLCDTRARGEDIELPKVSKGDSLSLLEITNTEKFTTPPNRYSEAGLIKELEKRGIGRPSTYASIIKTIIDREYVVKEGRTLIPTDTGDIVSSFLEDHFDTYIGDDFTAEMENNLDAIAQGEKAYEKVLSDFYKPFEQAVHSKEDIPKLTNLGMAPKEFSCPKCGAAMMYKLGRTGKFMSCTRYPDCDGALTVDGKEIGNNTPIGKHPDTGENIYVLEGRFGPYVQMGETPIVPKLTSYPKGHKKTEEEKEKMRAEKEAIKQAKELPQPRRASLTPGLKAEDVTLEKAIELLILPRLLGTDPDTGEDVVANIGRFGPYVGAGRNFRSIKRTSGLDPYTISFEEALALLREPKALPKGVKLFKNLGKHPKTGKDIMILESKSGHYMQKGLKRIYLDKKVDLENITLEQALQILDKK
ncbi:MAG: type I DNA topoisomerase [Candidatus Pacebacteria bacterium]|nr:type I DNA topoisomerase [Candidatus Paceibacterota bacterium]